MFLIYSVILVFLLCPKSGVTDIVENVFSPAADQVAPREFRAVWIATVANVDWPSSSHLSSGQQQAELINLIEALHSLHFNAIILQVRAAGDAFYKSQFDPWSVYLTGQQGKAPAPYWDPLQTAVAEAHKRGMELHAWINPYRARSGSTSKVGLDPKHIAVQLSHFAYPYGSDLWMDPGAEEVTNRTLATVADLIHHYDVDGIHMDDYFYPYPQTGHDFPDSSTYNAYIRGGGHLTLAQWRHQNIDNFIQKLSENIHSSRPWAKFGISPFGIWMSGHPAGVVGFSSNSGLYADSRRWLTEGWVDYLSPQLYWQIDPPQQSFTALSDWWIQQNVKHRHLYIGCAAYKTVTGTSPWPINEMKRQVEATRARRSDNDLGNIFFSAKYFKSNTHGIADLFKNSVYTQPALVPNMNWLHTNASGLAVPGQVTASNGTISWVPDANQRIRAVALYQYHESLKQYHLETVVGNNVTSLKVRPGKYALTSVDRLGTESSAHSIVIDTPFNE